MSESFGRRKGRRGKKTNAPAEGNSNSQSNAGSCTDAQSLEAPHQPTSLPATPHRAFQPFNDSVDNINLDEIRDLLPSDYLHNVGGNGGRGLAFRIDPIGEGENPEQREQSVDNGAREEGGPPDSPVRMSADIMMENVGGKIEGDKGCPGAAAAVECELRVQLASDAHVRGDGNNGDESMIAQASLHMSLSTAPGHSGEHTGAVSAPRRRGLQVSLLSDAVEGGSSCRDRSCVEVAEALLLGLIYAWGGAGSSEDPTVVSKPVGDGSRRAVGTGADSGVRKGGLRGVLGYVLHTLLGLYYSIFVAVPLYALRLTASLLWGATTTAAAVAYVTASWAVGTWLWLLLLPVRTAERVLVALWQRALNLAVQFLNQPPDSSSGLLFGGQHAHRHPQQFKQVIPTALNGHVHKH